MPFAPKLKTREAIGDRIRKIRESAGMTQKDFAWQVGCYSQPSVSEWETGTKCPSVEMLYRIAARMGCTVHDLLPEVAP